MLEILIVDDDKVIVNMLQRIIAQYKLGEVVATAADGLQAERLVLELKPQLVLVDLLLPGQDGITLVSKLAPACPKTRFIMLSQVNDKNMVGDAYGKGIDFFISKPINAIEVVSIVRRVEELLQLKTAFAAIENTARVLAGDRGEAPRTAPVPAYRNKLRQILSDIGIAGDLGSKDLVAVCALIHEDPAIRKAPEELQLTELLRALQEKYYEETGLQTDGKTIEMRIRRGVSKALRNLASLGIEDYGHEKFIMYSSSLFDYPDIKAEMDYLRGKVATGGKVNIRSFIRRLILMTEPNQDL